jgi:hypothetical protein
MGLIHSRASKKRDKAQAALAKELARTEREQRQAGKHARQVEAAGDSAWRQPTVGDALKTWQRNRAQNGT